MLNKQYIDVRADHFKNGEITPIAYIDNSGETNYIKKINNIENRITEFGKLEKRYSCTSSKKDVVLILLDERWHLEE